MQRHPVHLVLILSSFSLIKTRRFTPPPPLHLLFYDFDPLLIRRDLLYIVEEIAGVLPLFYVISAPILASVVFLVVTRPK